MTTPPVEPRRRMSDRRFRGLVALGVAVAIGALFLGVRATDTGDDDAVRVSGGATSAVERVIPLNGDEVIRQAELGIDLAPGYEGTLIINDIEVPADELRLVPELNQVLFTPGEGKVVEALRAGPNCAEAIVWQSAVGRGPRDQRVMWCFEAL